MWKNTSSLGIIESTCIRKQRENLLGSGSKYEGGLKCYKIEILEADVEAVLWVGLIQKGDQVLVLAVCYIPQESCSCGKSAKETLQLLAKDR